MTDRPPLLPTYPEYKPSGIPWLDEIPVHWEAWRLKTVCRLAYGNTLTADMRVDGPVPVYGSNGQIGVHSSANTNAPCIIVGRKGSFGKVNYSEEPVFAIDTAFFVDDRYTNADLRWLYYYLVWLKLDAASRDSAIPGLNRQEAYRRVGPIPPPEEQAAIARYLTHKDALIQRFLQGKQRMLDLLKQLRKSTIHYTVLGGLDPKNTPMKPSGIPWLDDIPEHWQTPRLKYLCSRSGIYGANVPATEYQDSGIRFIRTTDITDEGLLKDDGGVFLPKERVENYLLNDGDILISRSGTVGRSFLYQSKLHGPCAHAGYLVRFVPGPHILPEYLFQFTQTQAFQGFLRWVVVQSTIKNVNARKYRNAYIPLPPLEEQAAIAEYLDDKVAKIDAAIAVTIRIIDQMRQYRKSLIHEVVTGVRDVRKAAASIPTDPPPPAPPTP